VQIKKLLVERFRNLTSSELSFNTGVNLIIGQNGQGKTNLLESISFLGSTKSFRTSISKEAIAWGEDSFSVSGVIIDKVSLFSLGLSVGLKGKDAFVQGKKVASPADYLGKLITISFSPQDMALVRGAPGERRALLDRHLVDLVPSLMVSLVTYSRALKTKMSLIKGGNCSYRSIEPWNQILAREMVAIKSARARFVEDLAPRATACYERFSSSLNESFTCEYRSAVSDFESQSDILKALEREFPRELSTGSVQFGIHRDDLVLKLRNKSSRQFASQGQARSIVLSIKLAILELLEDYHKDSPVVLLDDVDAELDTHRADSFFNMMIEQGRQVFVTSTDAYHGILKSSPSVCSFKVLSGQIEQI
jgi:DNA replication and repair protein RecF